MRADQTSACPECLVRFARSSRCPKCGQPSYELRAPRSRAALFRRCEERQRDAHVAALRHDLAEVTFAIADDIHPPPDRLGRRLLAVALLPTIGLLTVISKVDMIVRGTSARWFGVATAASGVALTLAAVWFFRRLYRRWKQVHLVNSLRASGGQDRGKHVAALAVVPAARSVARDGSPARASIQGTVRRRKTRQSPLAGTACVAFRVVGHGPHGELDDACAEVFDLVTEDGEPVEIAAGDATIALSVPDAARAVAAPSRALAKFLVDRGHVPSDGAVYAAESVLRDGDRVTVEGVLDTEPRPTNYRDQRFVRVLHAASGSPLIIRDGPGAGHLRVAVTPAEEDSVNAEATSSRGVLKGGRSVG